MKAWPLRAAQALGGFLFIALFVVFVVQITARFAFNKPLAWSDEAAWTAAARVLAAKFRENFASYAEQAGPDVLAAGPV